MQFNATKPKRTGSTGGSTDYVKLANGQTIKGVFRGNPVDYKRHWVNGKYSVCPGDVCTHCRNGDKPRFSFKINFVVQENGALVAKVFESSWTTYKTLESLTEGGYDLEKTMVSVTRSEEEKKTSYTVIPVPNGELSGDRLAKVAAVALKVLAVATPKEAPVEPEYASEDIPF